MRQEAGGLAFLGLFGCHHDELALAAQPAQFGAALRRGRLDGAQLAGAQEGGLLGVAFILEHVGHHAQPEVELLGDRAEGRGESRPLAVDLLPRKAWLRRWGFKRGCELCGVGAVRLLLDVREDLPHRPCALRGESGTVDRIFLHPRCLCPAKRASFQHLEVV
jgi:hypothetical protein